MNIYFLSECYKNLADIISPYRNDYVDFKLIENKIYTSEDLLEAIENPITISRVKSKNPNPYYDDRIVNINRNSYGIPTSTYDFTNDCYTPAITVIYNDTEYYIYLFNGEIIDSIHPYKITKCNDSTRKSVDELLLYFYSTERITNGEFIMAIYKSENNYTLIYNYYYNHDMYSYSKCINNMNSYITYNGSSHNLGELIQKEELNIIKWKDHDTEFFNDIINNGYKCENINIFEKYKFTD